MSQRIHTTGQVINDSNAREAQKLMLYKPLASQVEQKKMYFYLQITPQTSVISPLKYGPGNPRTFVNGDEPLPFPTFDPRTVNPYYLGMGTSRRVDMTKLLGQLASLTVEPKRFKYQFDLETVIIQQDTKGWTNIRDFSTYRDARLGQPANQWIVQRTYDVVNVYNAEPTPQEAGTERAVEYLYFQEALKEVVPQPLFIRIKELTGGEPFSFLAQPSGEVATVNGGQPIIVDNLNSVSTLNVEFGHMAFVGTDLEYAGPIKEEIDPGAVDDRNWLKGPFANNQVNVDISRYDNVKYLDYNQEWFNNAYDPLQQETNFQNEFVFPASRAPTTQVLKNSFEPTFPIELVNLRSKPMFYNQQVSNLVMRFSVTLIPQF